MKIKMSFALVLLSCFSFLHAAQGADLVKFPKKIICNLDDKSVDPEPQILYTRLDKINDLSTLTAEEQDVWAMDTGDASVSREAPREEEAAAADWSGGYYGARINKDKYTYAAWSCDSEDREYTFNTNDLAVPADDKAISKVVKGSVDIEVRSEGGPQGLTCTAFY